VAVSQHRDPGSFAIDVPVAGTRRDRIAVRVRFSEARPLSADDRRPVSALLEYLGVAPASH
jgi:hypothetical protein